MTLEPSNPSNEPATVGESSTPLGSSRSLPAHLWLWALAAGLLAGALASAGGEAVYGRFQPVFIPPPGWEKVSQYQRPQVTSAFLTKENPIVEGKNAAAAYGLMGAVLGGALGLAGGLARRTPRTAIIASFVGIVSGAATGAALSIALFPIFFRVVTAESGLLPLLLIHAGVWAPVGAAAGLAFGIGLGGPRSIAFAMIGGLAGAALGTMAFEVANSIVFPSIRLDRPIPSEAPSRIMGHFCITVFASLGAALGVGERKGKS